MHPHHALSHADGPERGIRAAVADEHEHALADGEGRFALDTHREVTQAAPQRLDDDFLLVRRAASDLTLDRDAVPGPKLPVGTLKGLREQHPAEDDSVGVGDELLQLEPLDD